MDLGQLRFNGNRFTDPGPPRPGRRRLRPRSASDQVSRAPAQGADDILRPLVLEDGLVFGIGCDIGTWGAIERQVPVSHALVERIEKTFRPAFAAVWKAIPPDEQSRLLTHWREEPIYRLGGRRGGPTCPRPLILIDLEDASSSNGNSEGVESCGRILSFPAALTKGKPQLLQSAISRALATTYRLATREHWGLLLSIVEEPLERWQRRQKKPVGEAAIDRKAKPLERAYLKQVEAALDGINARWGL